MTDYRPPSANRKHRGLELLKDVAKTEKEVTPHGPRPTPQQQRLLDLQAMQELNTFLTRGKSNARAVLSPARALEHLKDMDVRELLGHGKVQFYKTVAERLAR